MQLYASAPESEQYKPVRELKAFAKTPVLSPGSSATLELTFSAYDLASFDESLSAFVSQEGTYTLQLNRDASTIVTTLPLVRKCILCIFFVACSYTGRSAALSVRKEKR